MLLSPTFFWNKMARGYAKRPVANPDAYQVKLDKTAEYLKPTDRVLEFGCGTGTTALIHAPRVAQIDAIDFSSEMIAIAKEKLWERSARNVNFEVSSFEDWPTPVSGHGYDAILGMSILHLVKDAEATLDKLHASLKPGGLFFSSTVCLGDSKGLERFFLPPLSAIGILPKIRFFSGEDLKSLLRSHGFELEFDWRPDGSAGVFIVARRVG
ncbi:class I SAM-dependent methyltransferase [Cognatishimia activa]|uniref:Putative methyltransferase YcgJ n=1 Tax=Cognatishimia activa TaxID=1715691 RepID=A0A0P1JBR1_9RHOB|nr:class I SAM-dependent methyltransferase [Cognatishimia activa]CUJ37571.1 putative methyltransferase YcgJ [Cognatishimia activa]CUK26962.1 putative methyltransferase YcgJ [Cognatishimia activa]